MLKLFRFVSVLEGLSYLVILIVTLGLISRDDVFVLGVGHGVLFSLYLILSLIVSGIKGWSVLKWLMLFMAAFVPFAFIIVEIVLRKENRNRLNDYF